MNVPDKDIAEVDKLGSTAPTDSSSAPSSSISLDQPQKAAAAAGWFYRITVLQCQPSFQT